MDLKKALIISLALVVILSMGINTVNAEEEVTLEVLAPEYSHRTEGFWNDTVQAFTEEYPHINVNVNISSWDGYAQLVSTRVVTGEEPDILNTSQYLEYLEDGLLLDLNEYVSDDFMDKFVPGFLEDGRREDRQYSVPFATSVRALFYNSKMFEEAGIESSPETWGELRETAEKLDESIDNIYPFAYEMSDFEGYRFLAYFFWGAGGGWQQDGEWVVNSEENIEALEFLTELTNDGLTNPAPASTDRDEQQQVFGAERTGMLITASFFPTILNEINPELEFGVGPIPSKEGVEPSTLGVADTIMAFESTEYPEEVALFLEFLYEDDNYYRFCSDEGMLPGTISVGEMMAADDPLLAEFIEVQQDVRMEPSDPDYRIVQTLTAERAADAILGRMTPKEALDAAQDDIMEELY